MLNILTIIHSIMVLTRCTLSSSRDHVTNQVYIQFILIQFILIQFLIQFILIQFILIQFILSIRRKLLFEVKIWV